MLKENRQKEKSVKRTRGQKLCETPSGAALQVNNDDANPFKDLNDPTGFDTACGSVLEVNEDDPFIDIINDQMDIAAENTVDESSDYEDFQVDLDTCDICNKGDEISNATEVDWIICENCSLHYHEHCFIKTGITGNCIFLFFSRHQKMNNPDRAE